MAGARRAAASGRGKVADTRNRVRGRSGVIRRRIRDPVIRRRCAGTGPMAGR